MIRGAIRAALGRLARRVAKDGLFEQPGERPRTAPLQWGREAGEGKAREAAPAAAQERSGAAQEAQEKAGPPAAARPKTGCVPVGPGELAAMLRPSGRALVINHWATWCEPCVDELPRLVRAAAGIGDRAEVIGLSWDRFDRQGASDPAADAAAVAAFADGYGVGYPSLLFTGAPEELYAICGIDWQYVPQTIVLGPDGAVRWHKKGIIEDDDVFALIRAATGA